MWAFFDCRLDKVEDAGLATVNDGVLVSEGGIAPSKHHRTETAFDLHWNVRVMEELPNWGERERRQRSGNEVERMNVTAERMNELLAPCQHRLAPSQTLWNSQQVRDFHKSDLSHESESAFHRLPFRMWVHEQPVGAKRASIDTI